MYQACIRVVSVDASGGCVRDVPRLSVVRQGCIGDASVMYQYCVRYVSGVLQRHAWAHPHSASRARARLDYPSSTRVAQGSGMGGVADVVMMGHWWIFQSCIRGAPGVYQRCVS
jgi:hypothetical protein